jgi:hypothetical protein
LFIFHIITIYIHSFNHIHTTHLSVAICRGLSPSLHRFEAQWESLPVVPSRESNSGLPYSKPMLYQLKEISHFSQACSQKKPKIFTRPNAFKKLNLSVEAGFTGRKVLPKVGNTADRADTLHPFLLYSYMYSVKERGRLGSAGGPGGQWGSAMRRRTVGTVDSVGGSMAGDSNSPGARRGAYSPTQRRRS